MHRFMRTCAALLIALSLCVSPVFAAASIVSPVANTVVEADSLLVSVKVTGSEKVDITVYREYYESSPAVYETTRVAIEQPDVTTDTASGSAVIVSGAALEPSEEAEAPDEEGGAAVEDMPASGGEDIPADGGESYELVRLLVKEAEYSPVDASALTTADLAKIAAGDRFDEDGEPILLSDGSAIPEYNDGVYAATVRYTNDSEIGFYTKQLSGVEPGLYKVVVKDSSGKTSCYVAVKEKQAEPEKSNIFTTQRSGALQFLRNVLRSLFR